MAFSLYLIYVIWCKIAIFYYSSENNVVETKKCINAEWFSVNRDVNAYDLSLMTALTASLSSSVVIVVKSTIVVTPLAFRRARFSG